MRCEWRRVLNTEMAMRCDATILALRVLAAEILCDAPPRCENTSDAMPRCRPLRSPQIQKYCGDSKWLRRSSFNTAGLFGKKWPIPFWHIDFCPLNKQPQIPLCCETQTPLIRKRSEYGFGEYGFKHRAQWVFWGSLSSGERAQWAPFSFLSVCQKELTEFAPKLSEAQWVFFSGTVLSKQYSARFLLMKGWAQKAL